MSYEERFLSIWNSFGELKIPEKQEYTICMYALRFQGWVEELLGVLKDRNIVRINQLKISLTDRFFEWQRWVPQAHRQRMGIHGHTCVFQVFESAYEKLRFVELDLKPPMVYIPQPPPTPPKPHNITGITLGERLDLIDE